MRFLLCLFESRRIASRCLLLIPSYSREEENATGFKSCHVSLFAVLIRGGRANADPGPGRLFIVLSGYWRGMIKGEKLMLTELVRLL
jgi:hypothetical protein